jgi:alkylation response protein AidB-like acyl-CoA dehydrogenase
VDLALSEEQRQLISSFAGLLGRTSFPGQVRAAEPAGFDDVLWHTLLEAGVLVMAVPHAQEGWGASMVDLSLVAEESGRWLAPAPLIECQVTARLLARAASAPALDGLRAVLDGSRLVSLSLHPARSGVAGLVPAGAVCDAVVVLEGDRLCLVPTPDERRRPVANLGSAPLADITLASGGELAHGAAATDAFEVALDEWLVLTASALVGIGAAAHEAVCRYAAERRAFGGVIGSYQGVAHPLAEDATRLDGARLLVQKAAWAIDGQHARGRELAALAFAFASETAEQATYQAIHFHGGYGFMLEHDVQLFYRRARGWARVWGGADDAYRRAAAARYGSSELRSA